MSRRPLAARRRDDRGIVIPILAMSLGVLVLMTSFTVDLGRLMLTRRRMQAIADVTSLDLVRKLDGRPVVQIVADPAWAAAITDTRARNNFPPGTGRTFVIDLGHLFHGNFTAYIGPQVPDAVRVTAGDRVNYYFSPGSRITSRSAVAVRDARASYEGGAYSVPSELGTDLFRPALLNGMLTEVFAEPVNVPALGYQSLAADEITPAQLAAALGFASVQDMLDNDITARSLYLSAAQIVTAQGDLAGATALNMIAAGLTTSQDLSLGDLIGASAPDDGNAPAVGLNVLDLLTGSAFLVNGSSRIDIAGLDPGIAGVDSIDLSMKVDQARRILLNAGGGDSFLTSAVEIDVTPSLNLSGVDIGASDPATVTGTATVSLDAGSVRFGVTQIYCPGNSAGQPLGVDLTVKPQRLVLETEQTLDVTVNSSPAADIDKDTSPVTMFGAEGTAPFNYVAEFIPPIGVGGTKQIGAATLDLDSTMAVTASSVNLQDGSLNANTVAAGVNAAMNPVLASIDDMIVSRIAKTLGVELGAGDVGALGMNCTQAALGL